MKKYIVSLLISVIGCYSYAQKPIKIHQGNDTFMYFTSEIDSISHDANGNMIIHKEGIRYNYTIDEIDSVIIASYDNVVYSIPSEDLNEWDEGLILPNQICILNKIDTLVSEHIAMIKYIENNDDYGISLKYDNNGRILSIDSQEKSFYFEYDGNIAYVKVISANGNIEDFAYEYKMDSASRSFRAQETDNNKPLPKTFENLQNFLNKYADKLAASDTPYLRMIAEDIRNLPENLLREGIIKGLSKLFGKRIPFLGDIIKYLEDNDKRRVAIGNCYVSLQGVTENEEQHFIKGALNNLNELPNYGELDTELKYGILCRYAGSGTDMTPPTIYWNDYKWEWSTTYQSTSTINISQELPKLSFGWYVFRAYEERFGVVKYCDYYRYFNSKLEEAPNYSIDDVQCRYLGDNKIEVSFTCTRQPIRTDILLYQGLELKTKDGETIISFGPGHYTGPIYTVSVKKTFDASLFEIDYSNFVAKLEIDAQFWYVPVAKGKTYFKDLEPKYITYEERPSITIKDVWSRGTEPYTEENDYGWDTSGKYSFSFDVKGAFFIDKLYHSSFGTSWHTQFGYEIPFSGNDETIEYGSGIIYQSGVNYPSTYYGVYGTTPNGNTIMPNNYIQFLGDMNFIIVNSIGSSSRATSRQSDDQDLPLPMNVPITDK